MKRLSKIAYGAVTAGALLFGGALPALASGGATAVTIPTSTYQGSSFTVTAHCPSWNNRAVLRSRLFGWFALPNGNGVVHVWVGSTVWPRTYWIHLTCWSPWNHMMTGMADATITVLPWNGPGMPPGPGPLPPANFFISTGFGGMARQVASHHPVA